MEYFEIFTTIILTFSLGIYLITNLQWYNYNITRVILKHHKQQWHIIYFISPIVLYYLLDNIYFFVYFYLLYLTSFIIWNKNLTNTLKLTSRVKRFLAILSFVTFSLATLCAFIDGCKMGLIVSLGLTWAVSSLLESIFFINYKNKAKQKLATFKELQIVAITASYGKTSIKNYLYQVLSKKFNVYMTPRSINTIKGLVQDVNDNLQPNTNIYIAEAGARQSGDIEQIAMFLKHHYAIIGSVGEQHIEYFKTLDNIIHTKMEILKSPNLIHGFVHDSVPINQYDSITKFPSGLNIIKSDLEGIWFDVEVDGKTEHFHSPLLGSFSAINLTAVVLTASKLGMSIDSIKLALHNIKPVEHRLHLSKVGGKIIIDDSFNGNLVGMLEAVKLASYHQNRKVIITPGIMESTDEANTILAKAIDDVFDFVIITGDLNAKILRQNINSSKTLVLKNKMQLEEALIEHTKDQDLVLFANDAPNFI